MNYRGTDKDGKKYFIEIRGKNVIISTGDTVLDKKSKFKNTGCAWSPQLHYAYNRLLDACIARKSPEAVCEAALAVVQAAKADNRFDD